MQFTTKKLLGVGKAEQWQIVWMMLDEEYLTYPFLLNIQLQSKQIPVSLYDGIAGSALFEILPPYYRNML